MVELADASDSKSDMGNHVWVQVPLPAPFLYIWKVIDMEFRDIYDQNKKLTGRTYKKGEMLQEGDFALVVITYIQNSRGEFLLQFTSKAKGNEWSSTGGHPKSGETSLQGIKTEVLEELGIDVDEREFEFVKTLALPFRFVDIYYLKKDIDIQEIVIQEEEVEKVKWATSSGIEQLIQEGKFQKTHKLVYEEILKYLDK